MFAAVRQKLTGAWRRLREGSLAKLFIFEFVVVLLGVLAAQWLAEWSNERQALRTMEESRARIDDGVAISLTAVAIWEKAIPCLDARMDEILTASAEQRTLTSSDLQRPRLFNVLEAHFTTDTLDLIEQRHGAETALHYDRFARKSDDINQSVKAIAAQWQQFALVNPDYGQPSAADFHSARASAGQIKSELVSMQIAVENFAYAAEWLGIERKANDLNRVPVPDCATIWRERAVHVDGATGSGEVAQFRQEKR